jgi:SAM-dependent methyltransferase
LSQSASTFSSSSPSSDALAELKEYYKASEGYRAHLKAKDPAYFEDFVKVVRECSSSADRILDIGCGTGQSTRLIMECNRRVIGTDLSKLFMRSGGNSPDANPRFITSDASHLPFADHSFDVLCAMEFIEHVWPVEAILCEMDRVLKPSGRLVLMSPNLLSPLWPVRDLPEMVMHRRFRPPFYTSYREAAAFFGNSCRLTLRKLVARQPQFVPRKPDLRHADSGGDYDSVYCSNARDLLLFFQQLGYEVEFAKPECPSLGRSLRRSLAKSCGSVWTSFLLKCTKGAVV